MVLASSSAVLSKSFKRQRGVSSWVWVDVIYSSISLSLSPSALNPILSFWQPACYWLGPAYSDRDTSAFQRNARDRGSLRLNYLHFANYLVVSIARSYRTKLKSMVTWHQRASIHDSSVWSDTVLSYCTSSSISRNLPRLPLPDRELERIEKKTTI